jgi:hypothetical protein
MVSNTEVVLKAALKWHKLRFPFVAGLTQVPKEKF